jgi:hypothetical protein
MRTLLCVESYAKLRQSNFEHSLAFSNKKDKESNKEIVFWQVAVAQ